MKRTFLFTTLVLVLGAAPLMAQLYLAFEQVTVANTAIGFTATLIKEGNGHPQANKASCRLETAQIRFRIDGTAPTATVGTILEVGDVLSLDNPIAMTQFLAIRSATTSGVLDCTYAQ